MTQIETVAQLLGVGADAAVAIAAVKASVVLYLFMHLKYENKLLKTFVYGTLGVLAIFIGLTFTDILYR